MTETRAFLTYGYEDGRSRDVKMNLTFSRYGIAYRLAYLVGSILPWRHGVNCRDHH